MGCNALKNRWMMAVRTRCCITLEQVSGWWQLVFHQHHAVDNSILLPLQPVFARSGLKAPDRQKNGKFMPTIPAADRKGTRRPDDEEQVRLL